VTTHPPAVPEALQHLHGLLALSLADERARIEALLAEHQGFSGKVALEVATACIKALQRAHGGDRLGSKGVYIPSLNVNERLTRKDRIRELMGPPPWSRKRAQEIARREGCHVATVWRVVKDSET
jgi:hypothetical protein